MKLRVMVSSCLMMGAAACSSSPGVYTDPTNDVSGDFAAANSTKVGGNEQSTSADGVAAQQAAQSADEGGSSGDTGSVGGSGDVSRIIDRLSGSSMTNFTVDGCSGTIDANFMSTSQSWDYNATISFNSCTGRRVITGNETIVATATDNSGVLDRTLLVTSDIEQVLGNGDTVAITSLDPTLGYTFNLQTAGLPVDGNVTWQLAINEHRVRNTSNGNAVFDHNVTTLAGQSLEVNTVYSASSGVPHPVSRTIVSGTLNVHHNLAHFLASHTFSNVQRLLNGTCLCPSSGTITQTVTPDNQSGVYTRTYTFNGCGMATVVTSDSSMAGTSNGTATITWANCSLANNQ